MGQSAPTTHLVIDWQVAKINVDDEEVDVELRLGRPLNDNSAVEYWKKPKIGSPSNSGENNDKSKNEFWFSLIRTSSKKRNCSPWNIWREISVLSVYIAGYSNTWRSRCQVTETILAYEKGKDVCICHGDLNLLNMLVEVT